MREGERGVLVGIVVAVGFACRAGFTWAAPAPVIADAAEYAQYAKNLAAHGVFSLASTVPPAPDSFRSPGYPAVLAACRWLGGEGGWQTLALGLQVLLGTLTVLLTYRLVRGFAGFAPALFAAALCALSPHLVVSTSYVLTECVATFAVVASAWLVLGATLRRRLLGGALAAGAAVLCNETLVFVPVVLGVWLWRRSRAHAVSFTLLALLPLCLWTVRNQVQPLARHGSERVTASISHGSYPGMVHCDPRLCGYPYREDPEQPAFGASWSALGSVLAERVAADPWRYAVWYACQKPVWLWSWPLVQGRDVHVYEVSNSPYDRQATMVALHGAMKFAHLPVMLLALGGALLGVLRRNAAGPVRALGWLALLGTLAYLPVIPDPRYLQPIRPLLFALAAAAVAGAPAWLLARLRPRPAMDAAAQP
ncbi:MAG: glycosyltransferase family 39 protein, partial [Planctomycetota bacterium]